MSRWCSMTRRKVFAGFAAAVTTISLDTVAGVRPTQAAAEASLPVILGKGKYRYQVVENWGELPPGYTYGDTAAVCVDSKDNVYVFTRGAHPVIVYDRNGKFLRSWGEDIGFTNAHGAAVGPSPIAKIIAYRFLTATANSRRNGTISCAPAASSSLGVRSRWR